MAKKITAPLTAETVKDLRAGDSVLISGTIYTGRDLAHKRLTDSLKAGEKLPFDLDGAVVYYVGPSPAKPGQVIGSAGPTTSYRMDAYTPRLLELGLKATLGKGKRSRVVRDAMLKHGAIYLASIAGAGALLSKSITKAEVIAFEDAGAEALFRFEVENFPAVVINDLEGNDFYEMCAAT